MASFELKALFVVAEFGAQDIHWIQYLALFRSFRSVKWKQFTATLILKNQFWITNEIRTKPVLLTRAKYMDGSNILTGPKYFILWQRTNILIIIIIGVGTVCSKGPPYVLYFICHTHDSRHSYSMFVTQYSILWNVFVNLLSLPNVQLAKTLAST